ncbi:MAG: hypothetical protein FWE20_01205 [Defluviitaleaceae bacterium]|nr:hypothetical protein [Defluviitaleaceae bacterium]
MEQILSIFNSDRRKARERFEKKYKEMKMRQADRSAAEYYDTEPRAAGSDFANPRAARQDTARQEAVRQDTARREAERREAEQWETARKDAVRQETERQEAVRREAERKETARQEAVRREAARREAERWEAARQEAIRQEIELREAEQREAARQESIRQETERRKDERKEAEEAARQESMRSKVIRIDTRRPRVERKEARIAASPEAENPEAVSAAHMAVESPDAVVMRPRVALLGAAGPIDADIETWGDSLHDRLYNWVVTKLSRRTQQIVAIAVFAAACYAFTGVVGGIYSEANDRNHVNLWSQQRFDDFYALPEGWLDMVFLGSSHSFTTFDPAQFEGRWNAFQLGMPLQTPDSSFFTLLEVYNYQRPDIVVMELYWNVMRRDFEPAQVETFFRVLRSEELRQRYIDEVLPLNERVKYDIEAIRFQDAAFAFANAWIRNFTRDSEIFQDGYTPEIQPYIEYYRALGYVYSSRIMPQAEFERLSRTPARRLNFQIAPSQRHFLEEMVRLTAEQGSQLIFVTAPISNVSFANILNYEDIHREISGFAELHGIPYLDFHLSNMEQELFRDYMFRDHGHLNDTGARVAGAYFIEWLEGVLEGGNSN